MPVYEYRCAACQRRFDKRTSMAERDDASACPACGDVRVTRLVSTFAAFSANGGELATLGGGCCGGGGGGCACRG